MARENFYLILELPFDPPEEDPAVIEQAIEKKRLEWSKQATDFKKGPVYRAYSAMLPEIRAVMADEGRRKKEYEEAYRITFDKARHMLVIVEKRGYLYESEVKSIAKRLKVSEDIVRCACKVRIIEDDMQHMSHKRPESADKFKVFEVYLDTLNKKDYYDFINYNGKMQARLRTMPPYRLVELVKQQRITYARNTPEESAIEKLCAECEKVFATDESKKEYDEYLIWKNTEEVYEQVQVATELTKVLDEGQCDEAVKLLNEVIPDKKSCIDMLRSYCRQNGIAMEYGVYNTGERQNPYQKRQGFASPTRTMQQKQPAVNETGRKTQPNMPKNLKVHVDTLKRCNYISWEKTTTDSTVSYLMVRKRGNAPNNINDGELLGTVSGTNYTDATIYPGKLYYYAVFAVKRGVYSKGVSTQVGYLNLFEIEEPSIARKDGYIQIEWKLNYRELRVVIFKQEGNAPMEYGDGRLCYNANQPRFKDPDAKKPGTYYYRIFTTIYINGKRFTSKGVVVSISVTEEKKKQPVRPKVTVKAEEKKKEPPKEKEVKLKSARPIWPEEKKKKLPPMKPNPYMKPVPHADVANTIIYDIKVRKGIFKPKLMELIFTAQTDSFVLPPLLIVGAKNFPPVDKGGGVLVGTIEKQLVKKKYVHEVPMISVAGLDYIKLFLANEADENQFEVHLKYGSSSKFT